ncbi:uncharacterized protein LOC17896178 isoform X1 [Capsella rubella]|uniref:uncharacterized protein LOC17896178 isoform X1 n=1 Tax=Capsella rubella TaxID=81985 RepID=UPI000CD5459F|nr:uncharacterized protein LOC17896178 isoform X1 [Capsella rubella]
MLRDALRIADEGGDVIGLAAQFFTTAVEQSFTKRYRTELVRASCLYLTCREKNLPCLLIDFSSYLRVSIYELSSVYWQLCLILNIAKVWDYEKFLDPSVFIPSISKEAHSYIGYYSFHHTNAGLLKENNEEAVLKTARDIIASMKRDWIQTDWKCIDICGAAVYTAALSHRINCSKTDTVDVMHQLGGAVTQRLIQFGDTHTESSNVEELTEKEMKFLTMKLTSIHENRVLCMHAGDGSKLFGYALCQRCYNDFIIVSSGLVGGSNPSGSLAVEEGRIDDGCEMVDVGVFEDSILLERSQIRSLLGKSMKRAKEASSLMEGLKQTGGPRLEDAHKKTQVAITSLDAAVSIVDESSGVKTQVMEGLKQTDAHKKTQVAITSLDAARSIVDESSGVNIERNQHPEVRYGKFYARRKKQSPSPQQ